MHEAYVILAAFFAGAACTSGAYSARAWVRHKSDGWQEEHAHLEGRLEPYLRSVRELVSVSMPVSIAAEAEQWLEGNPDA